MKRCKKCRKAKPENDFFGMPLFVNGRKGVCIECAFKIEMAKSERNRIYIKNHVQKFMEYQQNFSPAENH